MIQVATGQVEEEGLGYRRECPVRPWSTEQTEARERTVEVVFDEPFDGEPAVSVSVTQLDMDRHYNTRVRTSVEAVTESGFTLLIGTWCDTYVYSIRVDYEAVG